MTDLQMQPLQINFVFKKINHDKSEIKPHSRSTFNKRHQHAD